MEHKLFELHAQMCQVFTSPKRLEILNLLRDKELSVGQLVKLAKIRQANLSQHLSILREKGVVKTRRSGQTIYYSLANTKIIKAFDILNEILRERLDENDRLVKDIRRGGTNNVK
ncbi:MAG: ArsR/SmtB family transcription factor [Candidatus Omnitrophota bacterium]